MTFAAALERAREAIDSGAAAEVAASDLVELTAELAG